jgi:hypothetical protein
VQTTILTPALPGVLHPLWEQLSLPRRVLIFNTTISSTEAADRTFRPALPCRAADRGGGLAMPDGRNWP